MNFTRLIITFSLALACLLLPTSLIMSCAHAQGKKVDPSEKPQIPVGMLATLEKDVVPAIQNGDDEWFMHVVPSLLKKANQSQLVEIEKFCRDRGITSVQSKFADLVMNQVEQGDDITGRLDMSLTLYLIEELNRKVNAQLQEVQIHQVMSDPLLIPQDWKDSEKLFWEVHVFDNELLNTAKLAEFANASLKPFARRIEKSADPALVAIESEAKQHLGEVARVHQELLEREAELRWMRLNESHKTIAANRDFESRFTSAMCIELDAEKLQSFFAKPPSKKLNRAVLNNPNLPQTVGMLRDSARNIDSNLSLKGKLFRSGLHYWLRGRYGAAPLAFGLLKTPGAMNSQAAMEGLYMPKVRPKPISAYHSPETTEPGYDRRHFYTWAVEFRPLLKNFNQHNQYDIQNIRVNSAKAGGRFW